MPSVNDPHHRKLERDCEEYLKSVGFSVASNEPHRRPELRRLLKVETIAAHNVRTRPDRVAIRKDCVLHFDAKTCGWKKGYQFAIEAIPYMNACIESVHCGTKHVFVCRRKDGSEEFGIEAGQEAMHLFDKIMIPEWRRAGDSQWQSLAEKWRADFKLKCSINYSDCGDGSGDMFVTIGRRGGNDWSPQVPTEHWKDTLARVAGLECQVKRQREFLEWLHS